MSIPVYDSRTCALGEGPLWHPTRERLFWFDIPGHRLLARDGETPLEWDMGESATAAGWIDDGHLLIATESGLYNFDIDNGTRDLVAPLEADKPGNRSNDGRADPMGGFWIGTMGKTAAAGAGAIHRFYRGEVRQLFGGISIPNAICFAPTGDRAYFADTVDSRIMTVPLDAEGWPAAEPQVFVDFDGALNPDGAVCDAEGNLWNAQWGASRVAVHAPDGSFLKAIDVPGLNTTCPAFGGPDLADLYVTSALDGVPAGQLSGTDGQVFRLPGAGRGQAEHRVIL